MFHKVLGIGNHAAVAFAARRDIGVNLAVVVALTNEHGVSVRVVSVDRDLRPALMPVNHLTAGVEAMLVDIHAHVR